MEALVHLDPERCICVLGPQVSAQYLVATGLDPKAIPAVMSHRGLVEAGIRKLVEVETFPSSEFKQRKETLLRSSYELDPTFPAFKVTEKLLEVGEYDKWLAEAFAPVSNRPTVLGFNATLEHLTSLQRQGMLLAYSHYDPVLLQTQRFRCILMDDEEGVREWKSTSASGRAQPTGISSLLYIHGSLDQPSSLRWDSVAYCREVGDSPGGRALKEVCKSRCVVFLGFDADFFDPLILKFCTTFLSTAVQTPPLLLSTQPSHQPVLPSVLTVRVGQLALEKVLLPVPTSQQGNAAHLYRAQDKHKVIHVTLLYSDNSSGLNSADKIKSMSSVGATQITLTQDGKHHLLGLHTDSSGAESLWRVVCGSGSAASTAVQTGLLAVRLEGGVTLWLSPVTSGGGGGGASKAGEATTQSSSLSSSLKQEKAGSSGHPVSVPNLPLHSSPHGHNSTVSVISSHWASPIPSPSVTKLGSTPSPSTRPALPSPLMNSTSKGSPQRAGSLINFDQLRGLPMSVCPTTLFSSPQMHQHVRRIQSEHGGRLSYLDRLNEDEKRRRNGILIHQESAPAIIVNDGTRTLSVPSPSTLAKLQSSINEHRIECVDQFQHTSTVPTSGSSPTAKQPPVDFTKQRQQFIMDALEWSKKLSLVQQQQQQQQQQQKKKKQTETLVSTTATSTIGMSMEDQEKLLSQHFEKMQKQQASKHHSPSLALPTTHLPISSSSSSRPRSKSPKPSPIQLPSTTINPVLNPTNLYSFLPTTSSLSGLQSPATAASLFFNPSSHAQYSALLNQYFQLMSSQSMAAMAAASTNKQPQPLVLSDPAILQSLQQAVVVLPDGSFAPANFNLDTLLKKDPGQPVSGQTSPIKSPSSAGKRAHSPNSEAAAAGRLAPPPKRRRSSSLPDITQLPSVVDNRTAPIEEEREAEERETEEEEGESLQKEEGKRRNMPPLSMIQIPKEVKMHDPMLGFPTPPQSSPHFASSPLIPNVVSNMFQPHPMTPITPGQDSFNHEDIKDLVGETSVQTPVPPSPNGSSGLPPFPTGRGPIQLWQFLLDLLISPDKSHLIHWTGNGYEFRILLPEEIAKLWGARKNKPRMNYDKLSRGLRYYYSKGIMDKVPGKKLTFKYTCDVPNYLQSRGAAVRAVSGNGKMAMSTEA